MPNTRTKKVFYSVNVPSTDQEVMFVRADDACQYGRVWLAMWKAKTWRDFLTEIPTEYEDTFEGSFDDDADLDRRLDPQDIMGSHDGYFPPGFPPSSLDWMPRAIIERFGQKGAWEAGVAFDSKDAEEILTILQREGFACIHAPDLVNMMAFCKPESIEGVEKLIIATEREIGVPEQKARTKIRIDPGTGSFYRESTA
jgi:hypothetical protein